MILTTEEIEKRVRASRKNPSGQKNAEPKKIETLDEHNSVYAVLPPVTALLESRIIERRVAAFPEAGMEALHLLRVDGSTCIIAAAHGRSIGAFDKE